MKLKKLVFFALLLFASNSFAQNTVTQINTGDGVHYITTNINYPITGTYLFEGTAPIVVLNANGTGVFQGHDQAEKEMVWGIECEQNGTPKAIIDADSAAYSLWYKNTVGSDQNWDSVPFSIQFTTSKMYIQGERMKSY